MELVSIFPSHVIPEERCRHLTKYSLTYTPTNIEFPIDKSLLTHSKRLSSESQLSNNTRNLGLVGSIIHLYD
jgi:hypothetical protein